MSEDELMEAMVERGLPHYMHDSVRRYVLEKKPVGDFLMDLFSNNLEAFTRADTTNRACLQEWIHLMYWDLPSACWGSREKYQAWIHPSTRDD